MKPFDYLQSKTKAAQQKLMDIPFVQRGIAGEWSIEEYRHFLSQAFHHVKHTMPLLMYSGSRFTYEQEWLRDVMVEYIEEEHGHQYWILSDIKQTGGDADAVEKDKPGMACDLMVSYAYDMVSRKSPLGFLGMVHVLEGTSVKAATQAAEKLQVNLALPDQAFTYLTSHGSLDIEHVDFFEGIINRIENQDDLDLIVDAALTFYKLYGDIFREAGTLFRGMTA